MKSELDPRRGHAFYPDAAALADIPPLYGTENVPVSEKVVHLHYFIGGCDWYIVELDPAERLAFGWAELLPGCGEWGYISLAELESVTAGPFDQPVERDLHFTPQIAGYCIPDVPAPEFR